MKTHRDASPVSFRTPMINRSDSKENILLTLTDNLSLINEKNLRRSNKTKSSKSKRKKRTIVFFSYCRCFSVGYSREILHILSVKHQTLCRLSIVNEQKLSFSILSKVKTFVLFIDEFSSMFVLD